MSLRRPIDIQHEAFQTQSTTDDGVVRIDLKGCLDMETAPLLSTFLFNLEDLMRSTSPKSIVFQCENLYLMSSSSISHFAKWIKSIQKLEFSYGVEFVTNANLAWQRRTFGSIRDLAANFISVR